jgi:hypothetical protein
MMQSCLRPRRCWGALGIILLAGQLSLTSEFAGGQQSTNVTPQPGLKAKGSALSSLVYVPYDYDAPEVTESGGARSAQQLNTELPNVFVLAPLKLARTLSAQPTLYWYVSGLSTAPVRLTVLDLEATNPEPLLEIELNTVPGPGIYGVSLAEHDVRLEEDHLYEWSVALEINPESYSEEPVAKTIFAVEEADPGLLAKIEGAPALARLKALAAAGYWYDAIDLLAQQMAANDLSQPWRELRATLLEQVGLNGAAAYDWQATGIQ